MARELAEVGRPEERSQVSGLGKQWLVSSSGLAFFLSKIQFLHH